MPWIDVSVDYLVGKISLEMDKSALKRMEDISGLPDEEKESLFRVLDAYLRDFKARKAYAS